MNLDRYQTPMLILGAFLMGISLGVYAIGIQIETIAECRALGGQVIGTTCRTLEQGSRLSYWSAIGGGAAFAFAIVGEWMEEGYDSK